MLKYLTAMLTGLLLAISISTLVKGKSELSDEKSTWVCSPSGFGQESVCKER